MQISGPPVIALAESRALSPILSSTRRERGRQCILFRVPRHKSLAAAAEKLGSLRVLCPQPATPAPCSPEATHELGEAGPLTGVVVPAAGHEGVENRWAEVGLGQPVALLEHPDDILVLQPEEGLLAKAQDLPHAHG